MNDHNGTLSVNRRNFDANGHRARRSFLKERTDDDHTNENGKNNPRIVRDRPSRTLQRRRLIDGRAPRAASESDGPGQSARSGVLCGKTRIGRRSVPPDDVNGYNRGTEIKIGHCGRSVIDY
ncbi:hypothetical protein GWI33_001621 [Rhynchophorus ferrugineus]|uniref:Uncharacterized protein n=1 Tax=Rhynchophorus ferrugineus TaxID=354439 RepID=A0A834MGU0_RHYFE|nr:hypothetical protein GWI33_001621 [Rhynchophorus ferrugineus]